MDIQDELAKWESDWSTRTHDVSGWRHVLAIADRCGLDTSKYRTATAVAEFAAVALPPEPEPAAPANQPAGVPTVEEATEISVAEGFARDLGDGFAFDHSAGEWRIWSDKLAQWIRDETGRTFAVIAEYVSQARVLFDNQPAMATRRFVQSVEFLAQRSPRIACSASSWDRDPMLLGVPSGYVDLRTGELRDGDPAKRILRCCGAAPAAPGAPAPVWSAFMDFVTAGDKDLQGWLQRFFGYALTGDTSEEVFAFLSGPGGNGKGTSVETVANVMGDYALKMPAEVFTEGTRLNLEYYRAKMLGARLVYVDETKQGARWAETDIKEMTGGGKVNGRSPYGKIVEDAVQFKLLISGNNDPQLNGRSPAMERRLRVVKFDQKPPKADTTLKKRLQAEYPAILRWLIDGCLAWQRGGLGTCEAVRGASENYFAGQDVLGNWAGERAVVGAGEQATRGALYRDYAEWMKMTGEVAVPARAFLEAVRKRFGAVDHKGHSERTLRGIGLRHADHGAAGEFGPITAADLPSSVH